MTEHEKFVERHIEMLLAGDLDQVMDDYRPDAVLRSGSEEHRGRDSVRRHLEEALAAAPKDSRLDYDIKTQDNGQVVLTWRLFFAQGTESVMQGHDEFRFDAGRIAEQYVAIAGH